MQPMEIPEELLKKYSRFMRHPKALYFKLVQIPFEPELIDLYADKYGTIAFWLDQLEKFPKDFPEPLAIYIQQEKQKSLSFFKPGIHVVLTSPFLPFYRGWILEVFHTEDAESFAQTLLQYDIMVYGYNVHRIKNLQFESLFNF